MSTTATTRVLAVLMLAAAACRHAKPDRQPAPAGDTGVAAPPAAAPAAAPEHAQVIVVGAGMSGIAAAHDLHAAGVGVLVLEARDRIGGRTWTDRSRPSQPVDLGGSWIQDPAGNPLVELAARYHVATHVTHYDDEQVFATDGKPLSDRDDALTEKRYAALTDALVELIHARQRAGQPDLSLAQGIEAVLAAGTLGPMTPADRARLDFSVNTTIEHEYAGATDDLSLYAGAGLTEEGADSRADQLVIGGYDKIVQGLAAGLDVRLNQRVTRIEHDATRVVVTTDQGSFTADRVVVTLPVGVLKAGSVVFAPPLPQAKLEALGHFGMGVLDKVFLRFDKPFWADHEVLGYVSDPPGQWGESYNYAKADGEPALLCFNAAHFALALEQQTDAQIVAAAMVPLRKMYGAGVPEPTAYLITRWGADRFARGSYSYLRPGGTADDHDALAAPIDDRIFFAGEATDRERAATVDGAYRSGVREAKRIAALPR